VNPRARTESRKGEYNLELEEGEVDRRVVKREGATSYLSALRAVHELGSEKRTLVGVLGGAERGEKPQTGGRT